MAPPFVGTPFCTKPVGATDCTMADTALDGPLVSVLSTLVSVAVMAVGAVGKHRRCGDVEGVTGNHQA